jgi:hypothetical protein
MDIDVVVFTPLAPVWHMQGHALYLYIMGATAVPWFGPIPPIGHQGTQKSDKKLQKENMMWPQMPTVQYLHTTTIQKYAGATERNRREDLMGGECRGRGIQSFLRRSSWKGVKK